MIEPSRLGFYSDIGYKAIEDAAHAASLQLGILLFE